MLQTGPEFCPSCNTFETFVEGVEGGSGTAEFRTPDDFPAFRLGLGKLVKSDSDHLLPAAELVHVDSALHCVAAGVGVTKQFRASSGSWSRGLKLAMCRRGDLHFQYRIFVRYL